MEFESYANNVVAAPHQQVSVAQNVFPISIFQLEEDPNGSGTIWVQVMTETFIVEDDHTRLSLTCHSYFNPTKALFLQKHHITPQDSTSFLTIGETSSGDVCWFALRFFMTREAKKFSTLFEGRSAERIADQKRCQMRRKISFVAEVDKLEEALAPFFKCIKRINHLKTVCEEIAPFVVACERPTYRNIWNTLI